MGTTKSYGQFCPVAQASLVLAERWTPLVLRELICGSTHFNELRRGVPLMSPSLLSKRLGELQDAGVVSRTEDEEGRTTYGLTEAGQALQPIIEMLGLWGYRYARRELSERDLDPAFLMWDVRRGLRAEEISEGKRVVVQFDFAGVPTAKQRWWLVVDRASVDLCLRPPGWETDLFVEASIAHIVQVWLGDLPVREAVRGGQVVLRGKRGLVRSFPKWFGPSRFARLAADRSV